jgi:hypothetical protein
MGSDVRPLTGRDGSGNHQHFDGCVGLASVSVLQLPCVVPAGNPVPQILPNCTPSPLSQPPLKRTGNQLTQTPARSVACI